MERVVGVTVEGTSRAYPYSELEAAGGVIQDRFGERDIVVLWRSGTVSPLDVQVIARGRDVGAAGVFSPVVDGRLRRLRATADGFLDRETGSSWSVLGVATAGRLAGERLAPIDHLDAFWFAWAAFAPLTTVYEG